jgi:hypothetical protein
MDSSNRGIIGSPGGAPSLDGGGWYPQVIGLEPGRGTDKEAGEIARLFVEGWSRHLIKFVLP